MSIVTIHGPAMASNRFQTFVYDNMYSTYDDQNWPVIVWDTDTFLYFPDFGNTPEVVSRIPDGWAISDVDPGTILVPPGLYAFSWSFFIDKPLTLGYVVSAQNTDAVNIENQDSSYGVGTWWADDNVVDTAGFYTRFSVSGTVKLVKGRPGTEDCFFSFAVSAYNPDGDVNILQSILITRLDV